MGGLRENRFGEVGRERRMIASESVQWRLVVEAAKTNVTDDRYRYHRHGVLTRTSPD